MKKNLIISLLLSFSLNLSFSQNVKEVLQNISNSYRLPTEYYQQVEVKVFDIQKNKVSEMKACMKRNQKNYCYRSGDVIMINNSTYSLIVNDELKTILYRNTQADLPLTDFVNTDFDTLVKMCDSVKIKTNKENKIITFYTHTGFISKTELFFDPINYTIQNMNFYYNPIFTDDYYMSQVKVKMPAIIKELSEINYNGSDYVYFNGNTVLLRNEYKDYKLILN